jgi:hypothetical protein
MQPSGAGCRFGTPRISCLRTRVSHSAATWIKKDNPQLRPGGDCSEINFPSIVTGHSHSQNHQSDFIRRLQSVTRIRVASHYTTDVTNCPSPILLAFVLTMPTRSYRDTSPDCMCPILLQPIPHQKAYLLASFQSQWFLLLLKTSFTVTPRKRTPCLTSIQLLL